MVQSNKKDFSGQNISIGIDVHLRTWSVTVLTPSGFMRTHTQKASAKELFEHLNKHYPNGSYHAAYETGFSGFSTYYALTELGIKCTVYMRLTFRPPRRKRSRSQTRWIQKSWPKPYAR